jgi:hypothetical protein
MNAPQNKVQASGDTWSKVPWQLCIAGMLALPLAGALATRAFVLRGGPRAASAAPAATMMAPPGAEGPAGASATPVVFDAKLAEAYRVRSNEPFGRSPIVNKRAAVVGDVTPTIDPSAPSAQPKFVLPTSITVSSIMAAPSGHRAIIMGRLRRVGEVISPGWRIASIRPDEGAVTCVHDSGTSQVIRIKRPGDDDVQAGQEGFNPQTSPTQSAPQLPTGPSAAPSMQPSGAPAMLSPDGTDAAPAPDLAPAPL